MAFSPTLMRTAGSGVAVAKGVGEGVGEGISVDVGDGPEVGVGGSGVPTGKEQAAKIRLQNK